MSRIGWLVNRLRVMSLPEVMFRIYRVVMQLWERWRVARGWRPLPEAVIKPRYALFGDDFNLSAEWGEHFTLDQARLDEYLSGQLNLFGHDPLDVGNPVAWHCDPVTGIESPCGYGKTLNYRNENIVGNVKFIWELGRHQHLVPLAVAYVISGNIRYRQAVIEQIEGWIEQNPFAMGIHWCSSLESSLRLISWAVVHSLFILKDGEDGLFSLVKDSQRLGESIYQQTYFIRHFLSRCSSANNHLIGELTGLWVSCQVFDLGRKGQQWSGFARDELESEAKKQVHSDGVNKEQAFYYHLWVLEYLLFAWVVGKRSGGGFSEGFLERILAMVNFLKDVTPDEGEPPQIGDADDGFVTRFEPLWPQSPYREMLDSVDYLFGTTDVPQNQKAFWYRTMLAADARVYLDYAWYRTYPARYSAGGYAVLGGAGCHLVFDAGPLGYLGTAAHGHADALSFCLAVAGEWWLVDPGTYAYHGAPEWRSYFRGTAAHNTIRVNQQDQSQIAGPFMWHKKANARINELSEVLDVQKVAASHNGYNDLGVTHAREIRFSPKDREFMVVDELFNSEQRVKNIEIYFHFLPEVNIEWSARDGCWVATKPGQAEHLSIYTDSCWKYELVNGREEPILGWYSSALEEKLPTNTLRGEAVLAASLKSVTRIVIE